jgi:glycosyltransferase involved in cell wall biosynthesis
MRVLLLIVLGIWMLALVGTILNLLLMPRLKPRMPARMRPVSVIIPARNEERAIGRTVEALVRQTYPALEIIVVDDRSTDATGRIAAEFALKDPRVHVLTGEEPPAGWLGKPWALHQGSLAAAGELLLFIDADIYYAPDAIAAAVAELETQRVPMLALLPHLEMRGFWENVILPGLALIALSCMPLWLTNRTRIRLFAVGGGTGNLVERTAYEAAGGHVRLSSAVVDDVGLARLMRSSGYPTVAVRAEELVSVRIYEGLGATVRGFTKNGFSVMNRSYLAVTLALLLTIAGGILPYVLAATGDALAIAVVGVLTLNRLILFAALGYRLDSALFLHPLMVAMWCWIMLRSAWYTGIRREVAWRGRTYDAAATRFGPD